jgi:hypothetical protein
MSAPALPDGDLLAAIVGGLVATAVVLFAAIRSIDLGSRHAGRHPRDTERGEENTSRGSSAPGQGHAGHPFQDTGYLRSARRLRDLRTAGQVGAVNGAPFRQKRVLNIGEHRVFRIIENELISLRRGYRVFAQTSLGEILSSPDRAAFLAINDKRVDILVVDRDQWPVLAIEYQGEGHYRETAVARDTIKAMALNNAGVGYLEIFPADDPAQIRCRLREGLARSGDRNLSSVRAPG